MVVDVLPLLIKLLIKGRVNPIVVDVVPGGDDEVTFVVEAELPQSSGNLLLTKVAIIQVFVNLESQYKYQQEKHAFSCWPKNIYPIVG